MGKTSDDWEVGGDLSVTDDVTLGDDVVVQGNFSAGTGDVGYLATYNWLALDGDGLKVHAVKFWDFGTDAYVKLYVRNGAFEAE
jgi:hypothetical protein